MKKSILLCAYRDVEAETMECILHSVRDYKFKVSSVKNDALITRSRNIAVSNWLGETDDDVFLMVDGDMVFKPEDAERICEKAYRNNALVAGMYAGRGYASDGKGRLTSQLKKGTKVTFAPNAGLVEAEHLATGFLACPRKIIQEVKKNVQHANHEDLQFKFYAFFDTYVNEEGLYLSEDWAFSERVRAAGFSLFVDPSLVIGHLGGYQWTIWDLLEDPRKAHPVTVIEG